MNTHARALDTRQHTQTSRARWAARRLIGSLLLLLGVACSSEAWAWSADGHRLIADYALSRLSPAAGAQLERLLAQENGATLASVSTWADEVKSPTTAAWHYVNFPRDADCRYDGDRMCIQGNCVVGAIERQLAVLASGAPPERRLLALKYVVHFVGDVHQPLHAGYTDDRGGNDFQLRAYGRGTNLHKLWDSALVQHWPGGIEELKASMDKVPTAAGAADPRLWAEASCRVVASAGFYPGRRKLDESYAAQWNEQLPQQLALAGQMLAEALNASLALPLTNSPTNGAVVLHHSPKDLEMALTCEFGELVVVF